ncbi:ANTAR domain-containing response regulator [Terrisporobacter vanillatitrophus]
MENILIVSSSNKSKELLTNIAKESGEYDVLNVENSFQCREIIKKMNVDLIIINSPLSDDYGENLAIFANENTNSSIILIVKNNSPKESIYNVESKGIYIMEKPLNKLMLINTINSYIIHRRRFNSIINENEKLNKKINDIKLIDRAKLTLIQYLKMSEEESHKYIEKQAMDLRITKVEVAKNILKIYEY